MFNLLITCFNKTNSEVDTIISEANLSGEAIVGNQKPGSDMTSIRTMITNKCKVVIIDHDSIGVSENRNFLIKQANNDYVLFMDDDGVFVDDCTNIIQKEILKFKHPDAIKFNIVSLNDKRKIKPIMKEKRATFKDVSSYGVWGLLINRSFLNKNNLYFNKNVGPGREISSGEDVMFFHDLCKKTNNFYLSKETVAYIKQEHSSWFAGFDKQYMINKGYNYRYMFKRLWLPPCIYSIIKHHKKDKTLTIFNKIKYCLLGAKKAKEDLKSNANL